MTQLQVEFGGSTSAINPNITILKRQANGLASVSALLSVEYDHRGNPTCPLPCPSLPIFAARPDRHRVSNPRPLGSHKCALRGGAGFFGVDTALGAQNAHILVRTLLGMGATVFRASTQKSCDMPMPGCGDLKGRSHLVAPGVASRLGSGVYIRADRFEPLPRAFRRRIDPRSLL